MLTFSCSTLPLPFASTRITWLPYSTGIQAFHSKEIHKLTHLPQQTLFIATATFGITWLATPWLIPTEIYPTTARAQGTAISVIIWGLANFAVTLLTPILFNNLSYKLFAVFAATNLFAGVWTFFYMPETGGRSFDENLEFFEKAKEEGTWRVAKVGKGQWKIMPYPKPDGQDGESQPLLRRVADQVE